jgi:hypothetical protein
MVDDLGEIIATRLDVELSFARLAPLHDILARLAELQHRTMGSDALGVFCAGLSERLLGQGDAPFCYFVGLCKLVLAGLLPFDDDAFTGRPPCWVKRVVELVGDVEEAFDQDEPEADPCRYLRVAAANQLLAVRQLSDELSDELYAGQDSEGDGE